MYSWIERIRWKLAGFMAGRYGGDILSRDLCKLALFFWVLSLFCLGQIFGNLYLLCIVVALFRCFSRNAFRRQQELAAYLRFMEKPKAYLALRKRIWKDRKTHRYFTCGCGKVLRVPKGKGKIKMHCKNCGREMIKRT